MQEYDACRLLALNLYSFVVKPFTKDAYIDYDLLYRMSYEQQWLADVLIDLELESIDKILHKIENDIEPDEIKATEYNLWKNIRNTCESSRRTGCGFTALGDMLAALGLRYDSANEIIDLVMYTKMKGELHATLDLAKLRGPFVGWDSGREYPNETPANAFYKMLLETYPNEVEQMLKYGRRNVSWSTVAPTGSVSILTQTSSGIEPLFKAFFIRRKKGNPGDKDFRVDFIDQNGDHWMEYPMFHPKFVLWAELIHKISFKKLSSYSKDQVESLFKQSPWYGCEADDIDWIKRVELQAVVQKYTTHSISSTINLPENVTQEEVGKIYMSAYEKGLKGVTVYRKNSRSGVLIENNNASTDSFDYVDAHKRPKTLPCDIYHTQIGNQKYTVFVGMLSDKPYEVFVSPKNIAVNHSKGFIDKVESGQYNLIIDDKVFAENITADMEPGEEQTSRLISGSLRHRMDIKFIVEQLNKTRGDLFSFSKVLARVLKKYIPEGDKASIKQMDDCKTPDECNIVYQEGCATCTTCGSSKC